MLWRCWVHMGASFVFKSTGDPMRRMGVGIFFSLAGIFLQSLTEWVFRHLPIYYTIHILLGALASLYYIKRCERKAAAIEAELETAPMESPSLGPIYAARTLSSA